MVWGGRGIRFISVSDARGYCADYGWTRGGVVSKRRVEMYAEGEDGSAVIFRGVVYWLLGGTERWIRGFVGLGLEFSFLGLFGCDWRTEDGRWKMGCNVELGGGDFLDELTEAGGTELYLGNDADCDGLVDFG